jgi:hypothetical protein
VGLERGVALGPVAADELRHPRTGHPVVAGDLERPSTTTAVVTRRDLDALRTSDRATLPAVDAVAMS